MNEYNHVGPVLASYKLLLMLPLLELNRPSHDSQGLFMSGLYY